MQNDDGNPTDKFAELRKQAQAQLKKEIEGTGPLSPGEACKLIHELRTHQIELELQNDELHQVQQALLQSRDIYADLYDYAPVGYITITDKGLIFKANLTIAELLGLERGQLVGKRFSQFIYDDDQDIYYKYSRSLSDSQDRLTCEVRMKRAGDRQFWVKLNSVPIQKIDEDSLYFQIAITDITELKQAEEKLQKSHQKLKRMYKLRSGELKESEIKYSALMEALLTGVHMTEKEIIVFTNKQFANIFGYEKSELLNKNILDIIHPEDREKTKKILHGQALENDEFEIRGMKKNGDTIFLLGINTIVEYEGREAILGNILDITRRKQSEKDKQELYKELNILSSKLLSSEEIERKRIASEIHDSIGQALSAIKFSVENSLTLIKNGSISSAQQALKNIVPVTQQTIDEVRKIIMDLRPSILDDLGLKATISWFCREFENIYTDIHIEAEIYVEETDIPEQMKTIIYRILQEAFNNASKHSKTKHINFKLEKNRDGLELLVEDKGCGFLVERVLAGSTDKRGMGLASMRERASLSGGDFSLSSTPGVGTEIKVSWPLPVIYQRRI